MVIEKNDLNLYCDVLLHYKKFLKNVMAVHLSASISSCALVQILHLHQMGMSPFSLDRCWLSISITLLGESTRIIFHLLTISCGREDMHIHEGGGAERSPRNRLDHQYGRPPSYTHECDRSCYA